MNIFYLDPNPEIAAQYHCDKHVVKQVLESAQLLCTTHHVVFPGSPWLNHMYKPFAPNHPCAKWVRESRDNYEWLYELYICLYNEYFHRFGKIHASYIKLDNYIKVPPYGMIPRGFTQPAIVTSAQFNWMNSPIDSYRAYYAVRKNDMLKYTKRKKPEWIEQYLDWYSCYMDNLDISVQEDFLE